jgi:hypothetical protein
MEPWIIRTLIWGLFGVLITALCFWRPKPARAVVSVFFAIMALGIHGTDVLSDPQQYVTFAQGALIPAYRDLAVAVVSMSPAAFGLGMLVFEVVLAGLMLSHGAYAKLGFVAAFLFLLGIMPLGPEELANITLAVGVAYLATREFPTSAITELRTWLRSREPTSLGHGRAPA